MSRDWLEDFHAGASGVLERTYRDHYGTVVAAVRRILSDADAETVTHEVFYRLLSDRGLRENFVGGSFSMWLKRVATNSAIDHRRRFGRERDLDAAGGEAEYEAVARAERADDEREAKLLVDEFRRDRLPPEWRAVFDARFIQHLSQRAAADALGMRRSTLAYQEGRIRALLKQFLLRTERP
jgi:RNA polymerase sigma-70 factor (ECF subfamily)